VFDLDDTLYPYEAFVASGFRAVGDYVARMCPVDGTTPAAELHRLRGTGARGRELQALCDAYGWPQAFVPRLLDVLRFHRPRIALRPDAATALTSLRANGWRLGVLTNGHPPVQRAKVQALGVAALVDCVLYAEECVAGGKPARPAFHQAATRLGVNPDRIVMVGDDVDRDVRGARHAGFHAIHLPALQADPTEGGDPFAVRSLTEACVVAERLVPRACVHA
jgi:putative hydrolase of the HAD superfamily